uniref:Uncharacterized protein n=1 Tax=Ralstonia solanacearum TaxID=305 RepID=A0A0S4U7E2_RALSL|nr:protein of unknown function [Ralstonia solanacearum]
MSLSSSATFTRPTLICSDMTPVASATPSVRMHCASCMEYGRPVFADTPVRLLMAMMVSFWVFDMMAPTYEQIGVWLTGR